jgi:hypothetical protein
VMMPARGEATLVVLAHSYRITVYSLRKLGRHRELVGPAAGIPRRAAFACGGAARERSNSRQKPAG